MRRIALSLVLFVLLVFTSPLTAYTSALAPSGMNTPFRPEWIREGDYVTYFYSVTAQGLTATIHYRVTILGDSGVYLNHMQLERFEPQIPPNFPKGFGILDPQFNEDSYDGFFMTREEKVVTYEPEIELVRGLNNKTYEAYRFTDDQLIDFGECSDCNFILWYEKDTLIKVKMLYWSERFGMNVTFQQLIEDSNIQQLASPSQSTVLAKTVTTTIFVRPPQTTVTTTVMMTTTVTGQQTVETTTYTEKVTNTSTNTVTEPSIYVWAIGATAIAIVLPTILILRKRSL